MPCGEYGIEGKKCLEFICDAISNSYAAIEMSKTVPNSIGQSPTSTPHNRQTQKQCNTLGLKTKGKPYIE
jgi:hypothetical protein